MDGWLVVGRCATDDVPLGLFSTPEGAELYAVGLTETDIVRAAREVMGVDVAGAENVAVIEFSRGVPVTGSIDYVRFFEQECPE